MPECQIWHYQGEILGQDSVDRIPDDAFPTRYRLHATVLAGDFGDARLASHMKDLQDAGGFVEQQTRPGDVIVGPDDKAIRIGFMTDHKVVEFVHDPIPTPVEARALFDEWTEDYRLRSMPESERDGLQANPTDKDGTYRIWQAKDASAAAAGWSAFPADYRHAIDVRDVDNIGDAYKSTNDGNWFEAWWVEVVADGVRSTRPGDVIVDPRGYEFRIKSDGFEEIDRSIQKAASDEPPLERVERQLQDWKRNHSTEFIPDPVTGRIGPGTHRWPDDAWPIMTEFEKLNVVEAVPDWDGVDQKGKEAILAREVDFGEITRDQLNSAYETAASHVDGEIDERPGRRLFDEANFARAVADLSADHGEQFAAARDTTRNLIESVMLNSWPQAGATVDFGLDSQRHYEALYHPIRNGEIGPGVLDAAMGFGEKLTELVRNSPSNPHKDIQFHTSWDDLLGRDKPGAEPISKSSDYDRQLQEAAESGKLRQREPEKGRDR